MTLHNDPKYNAPEVIEALKRHGLKTDVPSQLSDSFRIGFAAARAAPAQEAEDAEVMSYAIDRETTVERVRQASGADRWAVRRDGRALNKQGEWEWEPMPSSRDEAFLERCRFATAREAIDAARARQEGGAS